jgi:hypothetical protein
LLVASEQGNDRSGVDLTVRMGFPREATGVVLFLVCRRLFFKQRQYIDAPLRRKGLCRRAPDIAWREPGRY